MSVVSEDLIVIGNVFQIVGAATEKAHMPLFSLVLGTKRCMETDDLRILDISEKCSRFTQLNRKCMVCTSSQFKLNLTNNWKLM